MSPTAWYLCSGQLPGEKSVGLEGGRGALARRGERARRRRVVVVEQLHLIQEGRVSTACSVSYARFCVPPYLCVRDECQVTLPLLCSFRCPHKGNRLPMATWVRARALQPAAQPSRSKAAAATGTADKRQQAPLNGHNCEGALPRASLPFNNLILNCFPHGSVLRPSREWPARIRLLGSAQQPQQPQRPLNSARQNSHVCIYSRQGDVQACRLPSQVKLKLKSKVRGSRERCK